MERKYAVLIAAAIIRRREPSILASVGTPEQKIEERQERNVKAVAEAQELLMCIEERMMEQS